MLQYRIGLFFGAASLAGAFSGILAYGISFMTGTRGLLGWSWIFVRKFPMWPRSCGLPGLSLDSRRQCHSGCWRIGFPWWEFWKDRHATKLNFYDSFSRFPFHSSFPHPRRACLYCLQEEWVEDCQLLSRIHDTYVQNTTTPPWERRNILKWGISGPLCQIGRFVLFEKDVFCSNLLGRRSGSISSSTCQLLRLVCILFHW